MNKLKAPISLEELEIKAQQVIKKSIEYTVGEEVISPEVRRQILDSKRLRKVVEAALSAENMFSGWWGYDEQLREVAKESKEMEDLQNILASCTLSDKPEEQLSNRIIVTLSMAFTPLKNRVGIGRTLDEKFIEALLSQINTKQLLLPIQYPKGYMLLRETLRKSIMAFIDAEVADEGNKIRKSIQGINVLQALELIPCLLKRGEKPKPAAEKIEYIGQLRENILREQSLIRLADQKPFVVSKIFSPKALDETVKGMQELSADLSKDSSNSSDEKQLGGENEVMYKALMQGLINGFISDAKKKLEAADAVNKPVPAPRP